MNDEARAPTPTPAPRESGLSSVPPKAPADAATVETLDDDAAFVDAILDALADGPATGYEIARRVEAIEPGFLRGREGYVYPALLSLWRDGRVEPRWVRRGAGARRVYVRRTDVDATPSEIAPPPEEPLGAAAGAPGGPSKRLRKAAASVARGLGFAPQLRDATERDVLQHLTDAFAAGRRVGLRSSLAEQRALRDFGDLWKIRTDLRRTARGRRTVLFPRGIGDLFAHVWIYEVRVLLVIVAVILFVRVQVVTAYHIPTRSMEPTLHGHPRDGDRILVNRLAGSPERFDIVVFDGWGVERKNFVKRCVGLPGEAIKLREGDLYVDGELVRKEGVPYEALLQPLYDLDDVFARARADAPADDAAVGAAVMDELFELWKNTGGRWTLDVKRGFRGSSTGAEAVLNWDETVHDDIYVPRSGDVDPGSYAVPDLRITVAVRPEGEDARVALRLTRGAETFDAVLRDDRPGVALFVDGEEVARDETMEVPVGASTDVRFAQVDRVLRLEVGDRLLRYDVPAPRFPRKSAPGARLSLRVRAGSCWLRPLRLERDVFWTPDYDDLEVELGDDEYFMLGDNSGNSEDSRRRGAVHGSRIVGKPMLVVWPPKRLHVPH